MTFDEWWNNKREPLLALGLSMWDMERIQIMCRTAWADSREDLLKHQEELKEWMRSCGNVKDEEHKPRRDFNDV